MEQTLTIEQAIKVAIDAEIRAYTIYTGTSKKVAGAGTKKILLELAEQELGHRKLLENVLAGKDHDVLGQKVEKQTRGIAEFLEVSDISKNSTPQDVMIFAMKEEEKAYNFYMSLKKHFSGTELESLFNGLAAEERGHKIKLEDEYEEHFMKEN